MRRSLASFCIAVGLVASPATARADAAPPDTVPIPRVKPEGLAPAARMPTPESMLRDAYKELHAKHWTRARKLAAGIGNPTIKTLVEWLYLTDPRARPKFSEFDTFLNDHPDWPRREYLVSRTEESMPPSMPNDEVLRWFGGVEPITTAGAIRQVRALLSVGDKDQALDVARDVWVNRNFGSQQERQFYNMIRKHLTREDHIERLDRLLWEGRYYPSRRMYKRVDPEHQNLADARLTLRRMRGGVDGAISKVAKDLKDDPGLVYERLRWRRRKGRDQDARELLSHPVADTVHPVRWWEERSTLARRALQAGHITEAYELARNHRLDGGAPQAEAEWLAGWIALRFLGDNDVAYEHFTELYRNVRFPISRSRGAYWAGRAAEEMGAWQRARFWYRSAAAYPGTFYGQLALGEAEKPARLTLPAQPKPDDALRATFDAHELVAATRALVGLGAEKRIGPFIRQLFDVETSAEWRTLVGELANEAGRPDLAVITANRAGKDGIEMFDVGYPVLPHETAGGVELPLVFAIVRQESRFELDAVSPAGARGLMQLLPRTARTVARRIRTKYQKGRLTSDPAYNLQLGGTLLNNLVQRYDGSYVLALAAYNAGPTRVRLWMKEFGDPRNAEVDVIDWIE